MDKTKMEKEMIKNHIKKLNKDLNLWIINLVVSIGIPIMAIGLVLANDILRFDSVFCGFVLVLILCFVRSIIGIKSTIKELVTYKNMI
jgi:uncharacterized membrane protein